MTLLEHFKDPYFWEIFFLDLGLATIGIIFLLLFIFVKNWKIGSSGKTNYK